MEAPRKTFLVVQVVCWSEGRNHRAPDRLSPRPVMAVLWGCLRLLWIGLGDLWLLRDQGKE